jgi:hypothetical protein
MGCSGSKGVENGSRPPQQQQYYQQQQQQQQYAVNIPPSTLPQGWYAAYSLVVNICIHFCHCHSHMLAPLSIPYQVHFCSLTQFSIFIQK